ncbi:MAG: hypothetical protein H7338_10080 [Candidatus Sericytochromatia bacterium]|nr:hypothetical protein [Candidatus Sericytochromatia bacterium]
MPKRLMVLGLVAAQLNGCYAMTLDLREQSLQPAGVSRSRLVRTIEHEERGWFMVAGAIPLNGINATVYSRELGPGERIAGAKVTSLMGPVDIAMSVLTSLIAGVLAGVLTSSSAPQVASVIGLLVGLLVPSSRTMTVSLDVVTASPEPMPSALTR